MSELPGIRREAYDTVNRQSWIDAVRVYGPRFGQVGSVQALHPARGEDPKVLRRFAFEIPQQIDAPPGTARMDGGDLVVTYPQIGWGTIGDEAGHFGELAVIVPGPDGQYHAFSVEHLRHEEGGVNERHGTVLHPWSEDGYADVWDTICRGKRYSPFRGTSYQPRGELCALVITSLTGRNYRTNLLPFRWPGGGGGEDPPATGPGTPWLPDIPGPQLVMAPEQSGLNRMTIHQISAWADEMLAGHGFDGVDLWLLGKTPNGNTHRLLAHPRCRIARVILHTDTDRGGPESFTGDETRRLLRRLLQESQGTGCKLLVEPSFDLPEIHDHVARVAEFVQMAESMPGSEEHLFGGRQHDSAVPLPGDYAAWGDHVTDKRRWESICQRTVHRAGGKPCGQTDRFRSRSGSTREKDWMPSEMPQGIRVARRYNILCSWGYLPDGDHEVGSRPWPNREAILAANTGTATDHPALPNPGDIHVLHPGTSAVFGWPVQPPEVTGAAVESGELRLRWPELDRDVWPEFSDAGPEGDEHFGTAWAILHDGSRWVAETIEHLRYPHEGNGTRLGTEKLPVTSAPGHPVGFMVSGPARHERDEARFRRRTLITWWAWTDAGEMEPYVPGAPPPDEPPPDDDDDRPPPDDGGDSMARDPKDQEHFAVTVTPEETDGVAGDRFDVEIPFAMEVESVQFWIGCWPDLLNEAACGLHVNKRNIAEYSVHKHYRMRDPASGTFSSHPGTGGTYRDHERIPLDEPLIIRPDDVVEMSWHQHPEHANAKANDPGKLGGTHFKMILRGRRI